MSIEAVIVARLEGVASLNDLIDGRIYAGVAPKHAAYPLVTFTEVGDDPDRAMGGETGLVRARYQFDVYAQSQSDRVSVTKALKAALRDWSDDTTDPKVEVCFIQNSSDGMEKNERLYRKRVDVELNYVESL